MSASIRLVVEDVAIHLGERGVAVRQPPQQDRRTSAGPCTPAARTVPSTCRTGCSAAWRSRTPRRTDRDRCAAGCSRPGRRARPRRSRPRVRARVEDLPDLAAEVALHLQHQAADFAVGIVRAPAQQLVDVRIHARRRLAGADGAENHDARVEAALRDRQPRGRGARPLVVGKCCSPSTSIWRRRLSGSG